MTTRPHPIPPGTNSDKSWGIGIWISGHITAAWADSPEKVAFFCVWIRVICANLPCPDCSKDALEYIRLHPPEGEDPFVWMWTFHNFINRKLGKPEMDYSVARDLYFGGKIRTCNGACGEGLSQKIEKIPVTVIRNGTSQRFQGGQTYYPTQGGYQTNSGNVYPVYGNVYPTN